MLPKTLAFLDVETTGGSPTRDRIIEIGIVRVDAGQVTRTFESLVDPEVYLPPQITNLTGITQPELESAPTFRNIKDTLDDLLADSVVVAHNARFDTAFLKSEYSRLDAKFGNRHLCTVKLSRMLFPRYRNHNLDSVIARLGLLCTRRHRAFDDAQVLWTFYQRLLADFDKELVGKAIKKLLKRPSLPKGLKYKMLDTLPEGAGVYIFYGAEGAPLYVGKSVHLKDRVVSHFHSDYKNSKDFALSQQIGHIETEETDGELAALLREKELIKIHQPLYNRQLRDARTLVVALANTSTKGYATLVLTDSQQVTFDQIDAILAVFKTRGQAKRTLVELAKSHHLCHKLLGLEKGKDKCFGLQIGQCFGACVGQEMPVKYNLRFAEAFAHSKVKTWPFAGPIVIQEGGASHVVYKWCYLGKLAESEDVARFHLPDDLQFDYDTYKIIANHLLNPKKRVVVKAMGKAFLTPPSYEFT